MRNTVITLTILSLLAAGSAEASNASSKEELVGVSGGAILGAVAGGPVGLIVGAAFGAVLGDKIHTKNEEIEELEQTVSRKEQSLAELDARFSGVRRENDALDRELERLRVLAKPELVQLLRAGVEMDLLFRTDETELSAPTTTRLESLATTLQALNDVSIQLDGFADERGDASYNQQLSERRVAFVREQLLAAGIPDHRIRTAAHGEVAAADTRLDSLALERKVSMTLMIDESPSLAANP